MLGLLSCSVPEEFGLCWSGLSVFRRNESAFRDETEGILNIPTWQREISRKRSLRQGKVSRQGSATRDGTKGWSDKKREREVSQDGVQSSPKTSGLGQFAQFHMVIARRVILVNFRMDVPNGCSECVFWMDAGNRWKALNIPLLIQRWQMFRSWVIIFSYIYTDSENMVLVWSETITNLHYLCNPDDISVLGKFQLYWLLWMFLDDPNARELIGTRDSVRYGVYFTIDYWTAVFWISQKWHLWLLQEDVILSMWEEII